MLLWMTLPSLQLSCGTDGGKPIRRLTTDGPWPAFQSLLPRAQPVVLGKLYGIMNVHTKGDCFQMWKDPSQRHLSVTFISTCALGCTFFLREKDLDPTWCWRKQRPRNRGVGWAVEMLAPNTRRGLMITVALKALWCNQLGTKDPIAVHRNCSMNSIPNQI